MPKDAKYFFSAIQQDFANACEWMWGKDALEVDEKFRIVKCDVDGLIHVEMDINGYTEITHHADVPQGSMSYVYAEMDEVEMSPPRLKLRGKKVDCAVAPSGFGCRESKYNPITIEDEPLYLDRGERTYHV